MKRLHLSLVALVTVLLVASPSFASEADNRCSPAGTWWGSNIANQEYLFTIVALGGGHFSAVADGTANYNDDLDLWENTSAWRGSLVKTGGQTYELTQIIFASPSVLLDPALGFPDILGAHGFLTMLDCDHFHVEYDSVPLWAWGQVPWVDDPIDDFGASSSDYSRMAQP